LNDLPATFAILFNTLTGLVLSMNADAKEVKILQSINIQQIKNLAN
jgi:hypothetical protein